MMDAPEKYVLDANVFMQAHRQWYRFCFCQGFWAFIIKQQQNGVITSIDRVRDEISPGDALHAWIKNIAPKSLFASSKSTKVAQRYGEVATWVMSNDKYTPPAKNEFMGEADGWIIAYAWANDMIVVTHEVPSKEKGKVKIPDVCQHFKIPYCNTFKMLEDLKITLKWP
jgi:hypothetical protein